MYFTVLYNSVYNGMAALISVYLARFSLKVLYCDPFRLHIPSFLQHCFDAFFVSCPIYMEIQFVKHDLQDIDLEIFMYVH